MHRLNLLFFASLLAISCNQKGRENVIAEPASLPPQFYYYPKANLYFDSANKEYFFQGTASHQWHSAKEIPAVVQTLMDKTVLIPNPPDPVWADNENHKLVYSAVLYALPSDTIVTIKASKTVRKPAAPISDSLVAEEKKEKKGLGKFFDRLFGRRKKTDGNN